MKPRSCFGGAAGAPDGNVRYNWETSAPATEPLLAIVAVTVAICWKRSLRPPDATGPVAGPAVAVDVTVNLE